MKHEGRGRLCKFQKTSKILDELYPPHLRFSKIKRKFREFFLISEENGRNCFVPMGTAGYIFEKEKQLTRHPLIIHPYSKFCQYWECLRVIEIFLTLLFRTFIVSQFTWKAFMKPEYQLVSLCADFFEMMDVALRFLVGYIEDGNAVLEFRKIFFNNVTSASFYSRLIASFPFEFVVYVYALVKGRPHSVYLFTVFLKIFQLLTFHRYLRHMCKIYNWSEFLWRFIWTSLIMILLYQWFTCFFYLAILSEEFCDSHENQNVHSKKFFLRHMIAMYLICNIFFYEIGFYSEIVLTSLKDKLVCDFLLLMVNFTCVLFASQFVQLLGLLKTSRIQYEELIQEVRKFLSQENLPKQVHQKVEKYFQFRFQNRYFREKMILDTVSPPLKKEISNFFCLNLLLNEESMFNGVPIHMAESLCQQMTFEVFLPGDEIVRAKKRARKVYFLYSGSVAAYSPHGKELFHLHEGQQFGESAFLSNNSYVMTAIALEMSECYSLQQREYVKFAATYPEYGDMVYEAANRKRKLIKGLYSGASDLQGPLFMQ